MEKQTMKLSTTASAAALVAVLIATPAFAQEAIQEPEFAFYHPDADVLNGGEPAGIETAGMFGSVPFGYGSPYDSYAYYWGPENVAHHGRTISRRAARSVDVVPPAYDAYDMDGRGCIPAPRVGAFATAPW